MPPSNKLMDEILYVESTMIPLVEVPFDETKEYLIDPTTGKPYDGIILEGCFADLTPVLNNNRRIYDIPQYLEWVKLLKRAIHTRGVYGELEHPAKRYNPDPRKFSHRILDIWYVESEKKVYGRVMILKNTPNGIIATDIIRSGGKLAISGRAAGKEVKNPDGSVTCFLKLLTTYDLVWNPGFSSAILDYKQLNEGFSGIIRAEHLDVMEDIYADFINMNESTMCFYNWYFTNLNESGRINKEQKQQLKKQDAVLEKNKPSDEDAIQKNLQKNTKKDLKESVKNQFFSQMDFEQKQLKKRNGKSLYDGSAGFLKSQATIVE